MKTMTRKRCTVDVRTREQVSYHLGQHVYDRNLREDTANGVAVEGMGVIEVITREGAYLRPIYRNSGRWFAPWDEIRPDNIAKWL